MLPSAFVYLPLKHLAEIPNNPHNQSCMVSQQDSHHSAAQSGTRLGSIPPRFTQSTVSLLLDHSLR